MLLLDEATAHLDGLRETALRHTVQRATEHCTVVLIAHRLSTLTSADHLVPVADGRVRDHDRHGELLGRNELYRDLAATQMPPKEA
ncbi:hypothetical protein ABT063_33335 [Streptomyces sp. NPDC002838]|uniref:hypothetical protein n=1 Tax=Streptomyces sp. NPDC002838 TaxID=3154436 RepID=UPI0033275A09